MTEICFDATLASIGAWTILRLPKEASAQLPTRGQTMVEGELNGVLFQSALEPDGTGSHWFKIDATLQQAAGVAAGDTISLTIKPSEIWPEPAIPEDVRNALLADPHIAGLWADITPVARWDWIRWIGATNNPTTRQRRIDAALSKLQAGERRPCCFNRSLCCDPTVSKNGVLVATDR